MAPDVAARLEALGERITRDVAGHDLWSRFKKGRLEADPVWKAALKAK